MIREQEQKTFIERMKDEFSKLEFLSILIEKEKVSIRFVLIKDLLNLQITMEPSKWLKGYFNYTSELTSEVYLTSERNLDLFISNTKQLLLNKFQTVIDCLENKEAA